MRLTTPYSSDFRGARALNAALVVALLFGACCLAGAARAVPQGAAAGPQPAANFTLHSRRSGPWSDPRTWDAGRVPRSGDLVQVREGTRVIYDVDSAEPIRMVHVAGTLTFARDRNTRLDAGLIKIERGDTATEDGFACDLHTLPDAVPVPDTKNATRSTPALEIGTPDAPIPAGVTATVRLVPFPGQDKETLPAIIDCGGRWDVHGAALSRSWVKLGASVKAGESTLTLAEPVTGWKAGDRVIVTASREEYFARGRREGGWQPGKAEERTIARIEGASLTLDRPLREEHFGEGEFRSEVADLSRNVVIESAEPDGIRGHTMYHLNSTGGISYAEFRHLGKEGVLGKYSIHFHLCRDSMRGSGVIGASIWDSRNRWITIHGTDYLQVRDCVGYQSVGHGFFLEDGTEEYNVLDRNLAVQAYDGRRLPKQVLPFDQNDGAGFWWAAGRNSFTRNVSCENDHYGYHFELAKRSDFDPVLSLRTPNGSAEKRDIRTIPFLRFEGNESHTEGLYSFNFGDDVNPSVHGDRAHPFIARNLRAWQTHYVLRPEIQYFLMDGLNVKDGVYGVYHPDYDHHVYRNIHLDNVNSEPINRGHDDDSIQYGTFTYDGLTVENCRIGRDPLIQLTCTSPTPGQSGHFRNLVIRNSRSSAGVVDLGGGPRSEHLQNGVAYYFHDYPTPGRVTRVVSARFPDMMQGADYGSEAGFTGKDVRAAEFPDVPFPELLAPVDDLPPATLITGVAAHGKRLLVRGLAEDNGEVEGVTVNGEQARLTRTAPGLAEWEALIPAPSDGMLQAQARDRAGNAERTPHLVPSATAPRLAAADMPGQTTAGARQSKR